VVKKITVYHGHTHLARLNMFSSMHICTNFHNSLDHQKSIKQSTEKFVNVLNNILALTESIRIHL